jgi:hypothetical protein
MLMDVMLGMLLLNATVFVLLLLAAVMTSRVLVVLSALAVVGETY